MHCHNNIVLSRDDNHMKNTIIKRIAQFVLVMGYILVIRSCLNMYSIKSATVRFLDKYATEDFSEFTNTTIFIRDVDENRNPIIFIDPPAQFNCDGLGVYVVTLEKDSNIVLSTDWTLGKYNSDAANVDTLQLQNMAQKFMQLKIRRLTVDNDGNVYVFFQNPETLSIVRVVNNSQFQTIYDEDLDVISGRWYQPHNKKQRIVVNSQTK